MLEKQIEGKIVKKAKELGFLTYKFSSPSNRGIPDRIFIAKSGKIFFIEFKSSKGKLSKLQEHTINKLIEYYIDVYVINNVDHGIDILHSYEAIS
jgi:Holliday junction resolvase